MPLTPLRRARALLAGLGVLALAAALGACADMSATAGTSATAGMSGAGWAASTTSGDPGTAQATARPRVVTSFYALEFATERIGGQYVDVVGLTQPGAEPHDTEVTARQTAGMQHAAAVIYLKGFQPSVDEAVDVAGNPNVLDVATVAELNQTAYAEDLGEGHGADDGHDHASAHDPHFWLDTHRYERVALAIADELTRIDPAHKDEFDSRATQFVAELSSLNGEFTAGLRTCRIRELVTSHAAFGYLADRYGLHQYGISGLSPDSEPSPETLKMVTDMVRADGVTTIYQETLVEPHFAQTVASETGAKLATLDPVEGITTESAGRDYFEVMRANLATLRAGQECA